MMVEGEAVSTTMVICFVSTEWFLFSRKTFETGGLTFSISLMNSSIGVELGASAISVKPAHPGPAGRHLLAAELTADLAAELAAVITVDIAVKIVAKLTEGNSSPGTQSGVSLGMETNSAVSKVSTVVSLPGIGPTSGEVRCPGAAGAAGSADRHCRGRRGQGTGTGGVGAGPGVGGVSAAPDSESVLLAEVSLSRSSRCSSLKSSALVVGPLVSAVSCTMNIFSAWLR